ASLAHQQARDRLTEERTRLREAADQLEEFGRLEGAKVCRQCGQGLTPGHYEVEKARRAKERDQAEALAREAEQVRERAAGQERVAVMEKDEVAARLAAAGEEAREHRRRQGEAERDADRHLRECARLFQELPPPFRELARPSREGGWQTPGFPRERDL